MRVAYYFNRVYTDQKDCYFDHISKLAEKWLRTVIKMCDTCSKLSIKTQVKVSVRTSFILYTYFI